MVVYFRGKIGIELRVGVWHESSFKWTWLSGFYALYGVEKFIMHVNTVGKLE